MLGVSVAAFLATLGMYSRTGKSFEVRNYCSIDDAQNANTIIGGEARVGGMGEGGKAGSLTRKMKQTRACEKVKLSQSSSLRCIYRICSMYKFPFLSFDFCQ